MSKAAEVTSVQLDVSDEHSEAMGIEVLEGRTFVRSVNVSYRVKGSRVL